jgi:DamX protein
VQYKLRFEDLGLIPPPASVVTPDATRVTANPPDTVVALSKPVPDTTKTEDTLLAKTVDPASGAITAKTSQAPPTDYYAVQLISSTRQEEVTKLLEKWQSTYSPLGVFDKTVGKQKIFVLVYGDFISAAQAKQAIAALPEELRKNKPWLVKMIRL